LIADGTAEAVPLTRQGFRLLNKTRLDAALIEKGGQHRGMPTASV
jgi:hypothetical protein